MEFVISFLSSFCFLFFLQISIEKKKMSKQKKKQVWSVGYANTLNDNNYWDGNRMKPQMFLSLSHTQSHKVLRLFLVLLLTKIERNIATTFMFVTTVSELFIFVIHIDKKANANTHVHTHRRRKDYVYVKN